jgi:hypothetical protein
MSLKDFHVLQAWENMNRRIEDCRVVHFGDTFT